MTVATVRLEEVCEQITDGTHYTPPSQSSGKPFLTVKDMREEGLDFVNCARISQDEFSKAANGGSVPQCGDVLFSKDGTVGKVHVVEDGGEYALLSSIAIIRPEPSKLDSHFLGKILGSPRTLQQAAQMRTGSALRRVILKDLKRIKIPLPPLPEQRRIAAILDKADAVRRKRQQTLDLADQFLRSAFLDLFGDPVTNPKGWQVVEFGDLLADISYGTSKKCVTEREAGMTPILRIPNVLGGEITSDDIKYCMLDDRELAKLQLKDRDLLFVRTNGNPEYIARCAVFDGSGEPIAFASYLIRARLREGAEALPVFLREQVSFSTYRSRLIRETRTTAGNHNISSKGLKRLRLTLPPMIEQERFVRMVATVGKLHECCGSARESEHALLAALTQRAFRGEL